MRAQRGSEPMQTDVRDSDTGFCANPSFSLLAGAAAARIETSEMQKFSARTSSPLHNPKIISLFSGAALSGLSIPAEGPVTDSSRQQRIPLPGLRIPLFPPACQNSASTQIAETRAFTSKHILKLGCKQELFSLGRQNVVLPVPHQLCEQPQPQHGSITLKHNASCKRQQIISPAQIKPS